MFLCASESNTNRCHLEKIKHLCFVCNSAFIFVILVSILFISVLYFFYL